MDDSINEYAKKLMERAQARKGTHQLKSQGLDNHPTKMSSMTTTVKEDTRMIDESVVENKPIVPVSPSNKENLEDQEELEQEDLEEDQDEEMEEEEEEEDAEELKDEITEENEDEVLPLSSVRPTFPLTKALNACPQSASPISRKTRLSALAKSINSWEDDLSTPKSKATVTNPAITSTTPKTPRYSVSTPPVSNRQNNPSRNSCHQFVAKVTVTGTTKPGSPSKTTPGSPSKYTNNIGVGLAALRRGVSPAKNVSEPSPVVVTPKRGLSPIKNVSTLSTPAAPETLPVMALKSRVSPVKNVPEPPPQPTSERSFSAIASPEKPAVSILNKRRMFEKDGVPDAVTAPKISKTTAWPPTPLNIPDAVNKSQPQKFNSRKSLLPDPSELTVAQKAKLFERQQQEQQQLRKKEQEVNQRLNIGKVNKNVAFAAKSEAEQRKMSPSKKPEDKPQFYFGESKSSSVPPPPPPLPSTIASPIKSSPGKPQNIKEDYEVEDDSEEEMDVSPSALIAKSVKRIKVIKKDDKMYPSLTDIENTEAETDMDNETNTSSIESSPPGSFNSSMSTSSLGSFIQTKAQGSTMFGELNATMACRQIDECIDEALAGQYNEDDTFMGSAPLNSSSPIPVPKPLMHTVSVYRKKQQQNKMLDDEPVFKTPQNLNAVDEDEEETKEDLHDKMQNFEQQILIQQKAISQASKALNICESSFEFSNSTENVEGERVLLIATQKRAQLLSHISKLRNGKQNDGGSSPSKDKYKPSSCTRGTMRMDSIQLYPIKSARLHQDYVYHFIVIIKHNENVYATSTVKTSASSTIIEFPNEFMIQELDPGFKVQVEVYALRTFKQMDVIPHNMKYHIKNSNTSSSGSSTPSKGSTLSQFLTPTRSSKHTPKATNLRSTTAGGNTLSSNSVRTSNFTLQAILNLNLSNLNKTEWEMSLVNSSLILPNISMKIKCTNKNELNYKGFLTVFSDVSGLGAWHRRWAKLDQEYRLVFWTYPEDESQDKPPVLTVSLASCITPRVSPTPREVCARPNTFLLSTTREPLSTDENSLVVSVHEKYTTIKHMFSADNRMERDDWMRVINTTLTNMRAWGIN